MTDPKQPGVGRRGFLKSVGVAGAASAVAPLAAATAQAQTPPHAEHGTAAAQGAHAWRFFNAIEAKFIEAAVDTLIPHDAVGPGALESGVAEFIDNQLAGAYGQGARMYREGPFLEGKPTQGYQLPLSPAELYRIGIADVNRHCQRSHKKRFDQLAAAERSSLLEELESRKLTLESVPGATFFGLLLGNVMEGYFGDPMYGGNRDKAVWKMIGFPGAGAMYADVIAEYRNRPYITEPKSIEDLS